MTSKGLEFMHSIIRKTIVISFVSLALVHATEGPTDCSVEAPTKPILQENDIKKGTHHFQILPPKTDTAPEAEESAILNSGAPVKISFGGCSHWGIRYRFELGQVSEKDCSSALRKAIQLLDEVHANYIDVLRQRLTQKTPYVCGEELSVMPDVPGYGTISVNLSDASLDVNIQLNP